MTCKHKNEEWFWKVQSCNEYGWHCMDCEEPFPGEPPGFSPHLDRKEIAGKVHGLMLDMMDANFVHFSNSDHGHHVCTTVVDWCKRKGIYDQYSIIGRIFKVDGKRHAKFWKKIGKGVIKGKDPRDRCDCGALSNISSIRKGEILHSCSDCARENRTGIHSLEAGDDG